MPKKQRKNEEVEAVKTEILEHAVNLINDKGFEGFKMRTLAARLGVTATTIYSYYVNKDEIYLAILTEGFQRLYDQCLAAYNRHKAPFDRVMAIARTYVEFGLSQPHFYNLMFTWHVPKYNDYIGSPMEPTAKLELETALQNTELFIKAIKACAGNDRLMTEADAKFYLLVFWSTLHGYIAGINNTLADYMHASPRSIKERVLNLVEATMRKEMETLAGN